MKPTAKQKAHVHAFRRWLGYLRNAAIPEGETHDASLCSCGAVRIHKWIPVPDEPDADCTEAAEVILPRRKK